MALEAPVFIIGTGRSGSTMLHNTLASHPELSWLTQLVNRYPHKPQLNAMVMSFMTGSDLAYRCLHQRLYAAEPYAFFERYYPGFSKPYRDLMAADIRLLAAERFRNALEAAACKNRTLIVKFTGWSRIGLLREIFPEAKFIHIYRDGRAVINSSLESPYFDGWSGPCNWTRGDMTPAQIDAWKASDESYAILAAIGWVNRMNSYKEALKAVSNEQYLEIKYEDIASAPETSLQRALDFIGLSEQGNRRFFERIRQDTFHNHNEKWKRNFTPDQQAQINQFLAPELKKWGYE